MKPVEKFVIGFVLTMGVFAIMRALQKNTSPLNVVIDAASAALQLTRRGLRNNNPGNIRISPAKWGGELAKNTDGVFEQFDTPENGIRALSKLLVNYGAKYGDNTVARIVSRYAPSNENDTRAYIAAVVKHSGIAENTTLNLPKDKASLLSLTAAIIKHENGIQPYTAETLNRGLSWL